GGGPSVSPTSLTVLILLLIWVREMPATAAPLMSTTARPAETNFRTVRNGLLFLSLPWRAMPAGFDDRLERGRSSLMSSSFRSAMAVVSDACGGRGIRTHETFPPTSFQDWLHRPLGQPSRRP